MLTVYGIKQCDTCRKALKWLAAEGIGHQFHDFRSDGLHVDLLRGWLESSFADKLVNRRSTTWRQLTGRQRSSEGDALLELLIKHPTLIKRPVFVADEIIAVGFKPGELAELCS
jgi:Spx/MgsR family transcriptional regulator